MKIAISIVCILVALWVIDFGLKSYEVRKCVMGIDSRLPECQKKHLK